MNFTALTTFTLSLAPSERQAFGSKLHISLNLSGRIGWLMINNLKTWTRICSDAGVSFVSYEVIETSVPALNGGQWNGLRMALYVESWEETEVERGEMEKVDQAVQNAVWVEKD